MKILANPLPATGKPQVPDLPPEEHERDADSFADLVAAMLTAERDSSRGESANGLAASPNIDFECRAAALTPAIGTHGKSFQGGRLLVGTALGFGDDGPTSPIQSYVLARVHEGLATLAAGKSEVLPSSLNESVQEMDTQRLTRAIIGGSAQGIEPVQGNDQVSSRSPRASAMPAVGFQENPWHSVAGDVELAATEQALAKKTGAKNDGQFSPFGAHLIAFEGGLRLLLRVPKLSDGERAELEAGLARLLESFGHRQHDIVIHEIAKGEG